MAKALTPDYPRGITFEMVWTALMEDRKAAEESRKEFDRRMEESDRQTAEIKQSMRETDRQIKETDRQMKETDRQMKETDKRMGELYNRFGEMAEHLVAPGIAKRFNELGYHFNTIMPGGQKIIDGQGKVIAEIDLLLENDDYIVAIEVKATVRMNDIEHHNKRLKILREWWDKQRKTPKIILGAIAGAIFGSVEKTAVIEAGLYTLEQSGDTMIMDLPKGFVPRRW